jgi:hypothetical protein
VKNEFCQTIQRLGKEALLVDGRDNLTLFAATALPEIDAIYERFYVQYEAYQTALADWQARYGNNSGANAPALGHFCYVFGALSYRYCGTSTNFQRIKNPAIKGGNRRVFNCCCSPQGEGGVESGKQQSRYI